MDRPLKVGLAPINSTVGDAHGNMNLHIRAALRLARAGCDLVVFPKMGVLGWPTGNTTQWAGVVANVWTEILRFAKATSKSPAYFVVGVPVTHKGKVYIAAVIVKRGRIQAVIPQKQIPATDTTFFASGNFRRLRWLGETGFGQQSLQFDFGKTVVLVGEDLDSPHLQVRVAGAAIVIVQEARCYQSGLETKRRKKLLSLSRGRIVITVNGYGMNEGLTFEGDCLILQDGRVVRQTTLLDRGKSLIAEVPPPETDAPFKKIRIRAATDDENTHWQVLFERRVLGALDYLRKSGLRGFAIAESGGRDSMLSTIIALEALERLYAHLKPQARRRAIRKAIIGIGMPTRNNTAKTKGLARKLCRQLGMPYVEIPIGKLHAGNMRALKQLLGRLGKITRIAKQNGQARERSLLVMTLVNCLGFLMVNTCDGSEDELGFATKFGDGCGDIAAVADLDKGDIEEILWWYFNTQRHYVSAIRDCLLETVPGPELEKGQTAEGDLFPYKIADYIRYLFEVKHQMPSEIYRQVRRRWTAAQLKEMDKRYLSGATLKGWIEKAVTLRTLNVHKLSVAPLGVAVDPRTTLDRRFNLLPIITRGVFAADLKHMWSLPE